MDERCVLCGAEEERHYDRVQCPVGEDKFSATQRFTRTSDRLRELEREMATDCARSDIRSWCNGVQLEGKQWFIVKVAKSKQPSFDVMEQGYVDRAIEYLELRGLLERHPRQKWVHVKEASSASV